ncbi:MAG: prephenate dehydrogenase/arogenate dehydrogenase family protein [Verrucomicrobia bacterium]|nr:prephenate dehydrogenase/arogenate dehydrogenase family protein [Verrucomicrobiota bacterium]
MEASSVGVVGVGMMGGSIALAALRAGYKVFLYDRLGSEKLAGPKFRTASVVNDLTELVSKSRLIILATPIGALAPIGKALHGLVNSDHVVSDVASVKRPIAEDLAEALRGRCEYVPAHPMAGSEKSGPESARDDLFTGAVTFLCPELASRAAGVLVTGFWEKLGTRVVLVSVTAHDQLVAAMSHLPHLIAALLVRHVAATNRAALNLCGPGFRDATRIASGAPELWADILLSNADTLQEHLRSFKKELEETMTLLAKKDAKKLQALLDDAKENRDRLSP